MNADGDRIIAAHIEGLGAIDGSGQSNGYLYTTPLPPGFDDTTDSYDWRSVFPGSGPVPGETRSEPFSAAVRFGAFNLEMSSGREQDWLVELLFYKQTNGVAELTSDLSSGAPSANVSSTDDISAGDVIYIGAETIKVASTGSGTISMSGGRGYYGSEAASHKEGATIYTRPPFFEGRRVLLYTYDTEDGTLEVRARGLIDGAAQMSGPVMRLPVRQLITPISRGSLYRDANVDLEAVIEKHTVPEDSEQFGGVEYYRGTVTDSTSIKKKSFSEDVPSGHEFWEVGGELYRVNSGRLERRLFQSGPVNISSETDGGLAPNLEGAAQLDTPPVEVFAVTRKQDRRDGEILSSTAKLFQISSSFSVAGESFSVDTAQANTYPYHPLAIAGALLFSTEDDSYDETRFDILQGPNFGAGLAFLFSDDTIATMHRLILDPIGQGQQVDNLVLAAGGESFRYLDIVREVLLKPYGYDFGTTNNGKLTVVRQKLPNIDDYADARTNVLSPEGGAGGVYDVDNGQGSAVDVIEATVGGTPYTDGRTITLKADDGQPDRPTTLRADADVKLDLSTLDAYDGEAQAQKIIISRALAQHFATKRIKVRVADWKMTDKDHGIGSWALLDDVPIIDAYLTDQNGDRVSTIGTDAEWVAQIIGVTPTEGFAGAVLELILNTNDIIRRRAPSGVVDSATSSDVTLLADEFHPDGDAAQFNIGDELQVIQPDGTPRDTSGAVIASISGDTLDITGTWSTTPQQNDYVRLADYGAYDNSGLDTYTARVYVYLSDSDATLGSDDDDADIYGI